MIVRGIKGKGEEKAGEEFRKVRHLQAGERARKTARGRDH